jgi:ribosomal protein S18 acetylase RimI-like enzyme
MRVLTTYFEAFAPPPGAPVAAPAGEIAITEPRLDSVDYLKLYRRVGEPVAWDTRLHQAASELDALLRSDSVILYVLSLGAAPVGLCEFDLSAPVDIELTHFGLVPEAQRRGLGTYLLDCCLRRIWEARPRRVWLHTDTEDHPRAIPLYQRFGFRQFDQRWLEYPD